MSVPVFGGGVDDGEDGLASLGKRERAAIDEKLVATEEGGARPIDEVRHVFLGEDQRIVAGLQIVEKRVLALAPSLEAFVFSRFGRSGLSMVVAWNSTKP